MLKVLGIILILLTTSALGMFFSKKLTERVTLLAQIRLMLEELSIQIRYQASTVYELMDMLCSNPQLGELSFLPKVRENMSPGKDFSQVWQDGMLVGRSKALRSEDMELLEQVGLSLGNSDTEGQLSTLELHKSNLALLRQKAEEECAKKTKLYRSLGVLSGVFLSIILL